MIITPFIEQNAYTVTVNNLLHQNLWDELSI